MARAASGQPDPGRQPVTISRPACVGREADLAALAGVLAGPPVVVLVEGEAGVGKSRLIAEYLASEAGRSARPLSGGCLPMAHPHTLGPVVDALRQVTAQVTARAAGRPAGLGLSPLAGALRPLFPEWAASLPPLPDPLEDASAVRHRLFRALAELLAALDTALLVIEDVHWADEATAEFLAFLMSLPDQPVSVVVTFRGADLPADALLRRVSGRRRAAPDAGAAGCGGHCGADVLDAGG